MSHVKPAEALERVETCINELRPIFGLGPVTYSTEGPYIAAPLIASSDPANPTFYTDVVESRVEIGVEWALKLPSQFELVTRLLGHGKRGWKKLDISNCLLLFAEILGSNLRVGRRSYAAWDEDQGCVFVRDSLPLLDEEFNTVGDRVRGVVEHAREIWKAGDEKSRDLPESDIENGFPEE